MVKYKKYLQEETKKELGFIDYTDFAEDELTDARLAFATDSKFCLSVVANDGFPIHDKKEVAFAGRSNVGKSSLINSVTNVSGLARVSNTPGRTQMINFFSQGDAFFIVDLPGFGYAKASKESIRQWSQLTRDYLLGRKELETVFFLIDSRHGIKEIDENIMEILDKSAVSYQIILTKFDKIKKNEVDNLLLETNEKINRRPAARPGILVTSSKDKFGIDLLRCLIYRIIKH